MDLHVRVQVRKDWDKNKLVGSVTERTEQEEESVSFKVCNLYTVLKI